MLLLLPCATCRVLFWAPTNLNFADLDMRMLLLCLSLSLAPGVWAVLSTLKQKLTGVPSSTLNLALGQTEPLPIG